MDEYNYEDDLDQEQLEDRNAKAIEARRKETDKKINKRLHVITRKNLEQLSTEEKAFLKARASYLSKADREVYADIIAADYSGQKVVNEEVEKEVPLKNLNRTLLEAKAVELGIEDPDDEERFPNKQSLIDAIEAVQ